MGTAAPYIGRLASLILPQTSNRVKRNADSFTKISFWKEIRWKTFVSDKDFPRCTLHLKNQERYDRAAAERIADAAGIAT